MGIRQYFSGVIQSCVTGIAMMGKTSANRIIPIKLNTDGSIDIGQTIPTPETFKKLSIQFNTAAEPASGTITNTNLISQYWDDGVSSGVSIEFAGAGTSGIVFGGKLMLSGIVPTQSYKLYLFSGQSTGNFNGGGNAAYDTSSTFLGVVNFSTLISSGTPYTMYDGSMNNPIAFSAGDGKIYAILQNANGANINIPPGTTIKIQLGVLSK